MCVVRFLVFFFSSRRRHTRFKCDWSSDVCSSDLHIQAFAHHRESLAHAFFGRDQFGWSSFPSPFPPRLGSHSFRSMIPKYSPDRLPISRKREPSLTRLRRSDLGLIDEIQLDWPIRG